MFTSANEFFPIKSTVAGSEVTQSSSMSLSETKATPFALSRTLLSALLCYWPLPQSNESIRRTPSLLLCGDSGSGKTHLWRSTISMLHEAKVRLQYDFRMPVNGREFKHTEKENVSSLVPAPDSTSPFSFCCSTPDVMVIQPPLAKASLYTSGNSVRGSTACTPLRRLIQKEVSDQCRRHSSVSLSSPTIVRTFSSSTGKGVEARTLAKPLHSSRSQYTKEPSHLCSSTASSGRSVLVVLDHLELFCLGMEDCERDGDGTEDSANRFSGIRGKENFLPSGGTLPHASLLTDVYSLLTDSPPLFRSDELENLRINRIVILATFTGEPEHVPLVIRRCFSSIMHLSTPVEKERFEFFLQYISTSMPLWSSPPPHGHSNGYPNQPSPILQNSLASSNAEHIGTAEAEKSFQENAFRLATSLASTVALRSGGITYKGLTEMVSPLVSFLSSSSWQWWSEYSADVRIENEPPVTAIPITPTTVMTREEGGTAGKPRNSSVSYGIFSVAQRIVQDFQQSHSIAASQFRSRAGYVDVQVTRWSDIAGLHEAKNVLQQTVLRPLKYASVYRQFGVRPSTGILLYGPPGTGKTMLAKAMATELNASFVYMDLPALIKAEVGESEKRLTDFFAVAKERSPSVLFMDELQAAFGVRYSASHPHHSPDTDHSSGGTNASTHHESRLVSHLLQCLDEARQDWHASVVVVGATNAMHQLDPLLLRAGRLDTHIKIPLPDEEARTELIRRVIYGDWCAWFVLPLSFDAALSSGGTHRKKSSSRAACGDGESALPPVITADEKEVDAWIHLVSRKGFPFQNTENCTAALSGRVPQNYAVECLHNIEETLLSPFVAVKEAIASLQKELTKEFVQHSSHLSGAELRNATTMFAVDYLQSILLPLLEKKSIKNSFECNSMWTARRMIGVPLKVFDSMVETVFVYPNSASSEGLEFGAANSFLNPECMWANKRFALSDAKRKTVKVVLKFTVRECVKKCIQLQWDAKLRGTSFYE